MESDDHVRLYAAGKLSQVTNEMRRNGLSILTAETCHQRAAALALVTSVMQCQRPLQISRVKNIGSRVAFHLVLP